MKILVLTLLFLIISLVVTAAGALQCFAPRKLRELQKRLRPKADWSASAGGKFFEDLAERQASNPSLGYRLGGLALMAMGIYMVFGVVIRLIHNFLPR